MKPTCLVEWCKSCALARGYCSLHYQRMLRGAPIESGGFIDSFWSLVTIEEGDGCWIWNGAIAGRYGQVKFMGRALPAHRVAYAMYVGVISGRNLVCHRCDNCLCVRPDHLFLGTMQDNMNDMKAKGRHRGPFKIGSPEWLSLGNKQERT